MKKKKINEKKKKLKFFDMKKNMEMDLRGYLKGYNISKEDMLEVEALFAIVFNEFWKCMLDSLVLQDILKENKIELNVEDYAKRIIEKKTKIEQDYKKKEKK